MLREMDCDDDDDVVFYDRHSLSASPKICPFQHYLSNIKIMDG